jgi:hypothetical protein
MKQQVIFATGKWANVTSRRGFITAAQLLGQTGKDVPHKRERAD